MKKPAFDPIQATHSVERCGVTILFAEVVPDKMFSSVKQGISDVALKAGMIAAPSFGFRLDVTSGKFIPVQEEDSGPIQFNTPDQAVHLMISPNSISWSSSRYVRWRPFVGEMSTVLGEALDAYLNAVSPRSVRLDYVDRFLWSGSWSDFDAYKVLKADSGFIASKAMQGKREWHTHSGWFSKVEQFRRLTAVNIDIQEGRSPGALATMPSVAITTLVQDEFNIPDYGKTPIDNIDKQFILKRLEDLHVSLKEVFASTIVESMTKRIGLNG